MPAIQLFSVSGTETASGMEKQAVKTSKLQGIKNTFSNYMQQNSSNTAQAAQQKAVPQETAKTQQSDTGVQQQYEQYQKKSAVQADKAAGSSGASDGNADAAGEAVKEAADEIKEAIKENLGVSDEQLEAAMELLGLTQADLLNPQQVTALAVQLTGSADAGMMLFHEGFQNVMQEVTAVTDELLQDLGMTMEELTKQLDALNAEGQQTLQGDVQQMQETPAAGQESMQTQETAQQQEILPQAQETEAAPQETAQQQAVSTVQTQAQERPQEAPVQDAGQEVQETPQQTVQNVQQEGLGEPQEGQEQSLLDNRWKEENFEPQENSRFDFSADVRQPAAEVQAPVTQSAASQAPAPQINVQEVIEQIVEFTKVHLSEEVKTIEMQLNPENLGRVYLHVSEKQGTVTAQLAAQNENIKEALVQQAAVLKENLNQQGIKVDAVEVTVGTHEFESSLEKDARGQEEQAGRQEEQNKRRSVRSINLNELNDLDGLSGLMSEEEMLAAQIMRDNGNNVDFKA